MAGIKGARVGNGTFVTAPFQAMYIDGCQSMSFASGTNTQSAAFGSLTKLIRATNIAGACFVSVGSNPSCDNSGSTGMYLPTNTTVFILCNPGDKLAASGVSGTGSVFITEAVGVP